jgi:hypothetical protein
MAATMVRVSAMVSKATGTPCSKRHMGEACRHRLTCLTASPLIVAERDHHVLNGKELSRSNREVLPLAVEPGENVGQYRVTAAVGSAVRQPCGNDHSILSLSVLRTASPFPRLISAYIWATTSQFLNARASCGLILTLAVICTPIPRFPARPAVEDLGDDRPGRSQMIARARYGGIGQPTYQRDGTRCAASGRRA